VNSDVGIGVCMHHNEVESINLKNGWMLVCLKPCRARVCRTALKPMHHWMTLNKYKERIDHGCMFVCVKSCLSQGDAYSAQAHIPWHKHTHIHTHTYTRTHTIKRHLGEIKSRARIDRPGRHVWLPLVWLLFYSPDFNFLKLAEIKCTHKLHHQV